VKEVIDVTLPYPRDVTSVDFGAVMRPVYAALKDEVSGAARLDRPAALERQESYRS
jgi:hypothetical protein